MTSTYFLYRTWSSGKQNTSADLEEECEEFTGIIEFEFGLEMIWLLLFC